MSNWPQRSTAPGVTMATDFSTDAQVVPYRHGTLESTRKLTTRHMDNGVPCLKIATPADKADDQPQAWHRRLNDSWTKDNDGFGTTPFYIQFGFKIPASRLIPWRPGAAGWKIAIIANSLMNHTWYSSNNISHVMQDSYYRGYPTMYKHDNVHPNGVPMEGSIPGVSVNNDLNKSPGWDRGPTFTNYLDRYCAHSNKRGCPLWTVDVWLWFYVRLHTRTFGGTAGNELDMWWALPGDKSWTQLLKQRNYMVGNSIPWPNGFNDIGFTTFETGRTGPGADTYALYRELIVSTEEIAMPSESPVIVPDPVPVPVPVPTPDPDPVPVPVPEDNFLSLDGQVYDVVLRPLPPVDEVYSEWALEKFILTPEICPPSGEQTRTDTWTRSVVTPAANHGAEGAPLTEQRTSTQACAYVPPPDTSPPTMPTGLAASAVTQTGLLLNWSATTDDVGVTGYRVYRGGVQIGTPTAPSYSITGLTSGTAYSFTVAATDAAGNVSAQSVAVSVTTLADVIPTPSPGGGKISPIFDVSGNVPESWWAGLSKDEWLEVSNTKPNSLVPMLPAGFREWGNFGGWFIAWTGAAFDPVNELLSVYGGGHKDSSNNGLGTFDFRKMKWRWGVPPSVWTNEYFDPKGIIGGPREWNDGKPPAQHSYGGIVWSERLKKVLHVDWSGGGLGLYDPVAGTYTWAGLPQVGGFSSLSSAYDDVTGKWYRFRPKDGSYNDHQVVTVGVTPHTVSPITVAKEGLSTAGTNPDGQKRMTYGLTPIIVGREIFCLLDNEDYNTKLTAWKINIDTGKASNFTLVNPPVRASSKASHLYVTTGAYSPATGLIYLMQKPSGSGKMGRFITVNPVTAECGEFIPAWTPPPAGPSTNAPYTKFQIASRPSGDFMLLFHQSDANLRIVKLS